jgi:hypothetical protein
MNEMGKLLDVRASHVAYLENNRRAPGGELILRFRAVQKRLMAVASKRIKRMEAEGSHYRAKGD